MLSRAKPIAPGSVVLITGIQAAGKSTVAQLLAERLPRSVHVRGDLFRRLIVNGRRDMLPDRDPDAVDQLQLRYRLAAAAAEFAAARPHSCQILTSRSLGRFVDHFTCQNLGKSMPQTGRHSPDRVIEAPNHRYVSLDENLRGFLAPPGALAPELAS